MPPVGGVQGVAKMVTPPQHLTRLLSLRALQFAGLPSQPSALRLAVRLAVA